MGRGGTLPRVTGVICIGSPRGSSSAVNPGDPPGDARSMDRWDDMTAAALLLIILVVAAAALAVTAFG